MPLNSSGTKKAAWVNSTIFAGFKPLDHTGGNRRERAYHQEKAGGEPLGSGFVDMEIAHDGCERDVEKDVVQVAEEGADEEGATMVLAGKQVRLAKYSC